MRSFKKPLKMEEERYYLKMYRNGDEKAKEKLIEHNLRLVAHIVKKYKDVYKRQVYRTDHSACR